MKRLIHYHYITCLCTITKQQIWVLMIEDKLLYFWYLGNSCLISNPSPNMLCDTFWGPNSKKGCSHSEGRRSVSREQSVQKKIRAMLVKVPILVAISLGLLLFVAKMRFIFKLGRAKTDFNVFNYSLALRLIISGTEKVPIFHLFFCQWFMREKNLFAQISMLARQNVARFWTDVLLTCHSLPSWSWRWGCSGKCTNLILIQFGNADRIIDRILLPG